MEERVGIFIAELDAQRKEILKICSAIEKKTEALRNDINSEDITNSLAYKLHNLYSAYEDMFKMVARFFENQIDDVGRYHTDLLKRMSIEIEGVRPNVLSEESFGVLDELRGLRHVFRHAYGSVLDAERIIKLAEKSMKLKRSFLKDFEDFKGKLRKSLS